MAAQQKQRGASTGRSFTNRMANHIQRYGSHFLVDLAPADLEQLLQSYGSVYLAKLISRFRVNPVPPRDRERDGEKRMKPFVRLRIRASSLGSWESVNFWSNNLQSPGSRSGKE